MTQDSKPLPKMSLQECIATARQCEAAQDIDGARVIMLQMLADTPHNVHLWVIWLQLLLRTAPAEEALSESTKARAHFPGNPLIMDVSVAALLAGGRNEDAHDLVNKLHSDHPEHPINHDRLSRIYRLALTARCERIGKNASMPEGEKIRAISDILHRHFRFLKELFAARNIGLIFVNGNCQSWPLMRILNSHTPLRERYVSVCYKAIHTMTSLEMEAVRSVQDIFDIVLTQNIRSRSKYAPLVTSDLRDAIPGTLLTYPTCWFSGYFPDAFAPSGVACPPFPLALHSVTVFRSFLAKKSPRQAVDGFENAKIGHAAIKQNLEKNLAELDERDEGLDIRITDHIRDTFRKAPLFYTFNHCAVDVLGEIANRICAHLSLPPIGKRDLAPYEGLNGVAWHVADEVRDCLGLRFVRDHFVLQKKPLSRAEFVRSSYAYYAKLSADVLEMINCGIKDSGDTIHEAEAT